MPRSFLEWIESTHVWASLFGGQPAGHSHVFDSANGIDFYGDLIVLSCSCGAGRVFSRGGGHAR